MRWKGEGYARDSPIALKLSEAAILLPDTLGLSLGMFEKQNANGSLTNAVPWQIQTVQRWRVPSSFPWIFLKKVCVYNIHICIESCKSLCALPTDTLFCSLNICGNSLSSIRIPSFPWKYLTFSYTLFRNNIALKKGPFSSWFPFIRLSFWGLCCFEKEYVSFNTCLF